MNASDGTIAVNGGDVTVQSGGLTNCGLITVASARTLTFVVPFINGGSGVLAGAGTYNVGSSFSNGGQIAPEGILNFTGNVPFASNSACSGGSGVSLQIEICGTTPGSGYDRLALNGTATLSGTLNIIVPAGCCLSSGDSYRVITAGSRVGTFSTINVTGHGNPILNAQYDATGLTLVAVSNQLTVSASAGPGGGISPSGIVVASCGTNPSFTMTPNAGFEVASVVVDGNSVGAVTSYTFASIGDDHTISATFVDVAAPVVHVVTPNGGEEVYGDHVTKIRWTAADNVAVDSVQVEYSLNGAAGPWTTILRSATPTDSVAWTPPNQCSANALIRVTSKDPTQNSGTDVSDAEFRVACGVTSVGDGGVALALRVPNPVGHGSVHMRISLPTAGTATVEIIAVTGQKVWSSQLEGAAGTHDVTWNGRGAEPGVYFARLVTAHGSRMVRFVALR